MLTYLFIVSTAIQAWVAYHIYIRGRQNLSYLYFFALSTVTWLWVALNYLSVIFIKSAYLTYIVRSIMLMAIIQTALFYLFAQSFPNGTRQKIKDLRFYGVLTVLSSTSAMSPFMFKSVNVANSIVHIQTGPALIIFILFICYTVLASFRLLIKKHRAAAGLQRAQLSVLICAAGLNWILVPVTNFVITLTYKTTFFVTLSPVYGLLFSTIIAYAIARHYLFNMRRTLWDSVIYLDYYLRGSRRNLQYYQLQTLIDRTDSDHIALDFTGVNALDEEAVTLLATLRNYMIKQGKTPYLVGFTNKVFARLQQVKELRIYK